MFYGLGTGAGTIQKQSIFEPGSRRCQMPAAFSMADRLAKHRPAVWIERSRQNELAYLDLATYFAKEGVD